MAVAPFTKGYIVDLTTFDRFEFDFNPDNINDEKESEINETKIPGASHPQVSWGAGGARILTFDVRLVNLDADPTTPYVKNQVSWLRSLEYPNDDSTYEQSRPSFIQFILGQLYDLPCILKKCKVKWGLLEPTTLLPEYADLNIILSEVSEDTIRLGQVRQSDAGFVRYLSGTGTR